MKRKLFVIDGDVAIEVTPEGAERWPDSVLITADTADAAVRAARELGDDRPARLPP